MFEQEHQDTMPIPTTRTRDMRGDASIGVEDRSTRFMETALPRRRSAFMARFASLNPSKGVRRGIALAMAGILVVLMIPAGLSVYSSYHQAKSLALDGVHQLDAVKAQLPTSVNTVASLLNAGTLARMRTEIVAAQRDFAQLTDELDHSPAFVVAGDLPGFGSQVAAARHLARIGSDLSQLAMTMVDAASIVVTIMHRSPLSASVPFLTQNDLTSFTTLLNAVPPMLSDIEMQSHGGEIHALLSTSQQASLQTVITALPQISQTVATVRQAFAIAPVLLGLKTPVTYLVIAMDRSELRAGGGFQGNYAIASIQDGRLTNPLKLEDAYLLDQKNGSCWDANSSAPAAYQSWWPFGCWGIRDANLSADFPTSARYTMQLYADESGQPVQGVIALTPQIIQQLLEITGPIYVGYGYNVTVTSTNLEATIHRFELNYHGPGGADLPPPDQLSSQSKRFTALLARSLQDRMQHASQTELVKLVRDGWEDLQSKDIQIYSPNASVEQFLTTQNINSAMQRGSADGIFVVDTNLSGKQNAYVQESLTDGVQIDAAGTATHTLTLRYTFDDPSNAPTYGYFSGGYRDYVRVYVPPQSVFVKSSASAISQAKSDEAQRAMWAGFIVVGENAGSVTITLQWRVPSAVVHGKPYLLTWQKQAGSHVSVTLTIARTGETASLLRYSTSKGGYMDRDMTFTEIA